MKLFRTWGIAMSMLLLASCAHPDQNTYGEREVGHDAIVMYGIVKSVRQVEVVRQSTGTGATIGAVGGGLAGSAFGRGNGSVASVIGGVLIGGIAGAIAEDAMKDKQGIEYIIKFSETGDTRSVVQNLSKKETPISPGQCVMVQMSGNYQRVLLDDDESDCPAPVKHKVKHVRTKLTRNHQSETTIDQDGDDDEDDDKPSSHHRHKHHDDDDDDDNQ